MIKANKNNAFVYQLTIYNLGFAWKVVLIWAMLFDFDFVMFVFPGLSTCLCSHNELINVKGKLGSYG